jgi:hypothetical protein
MSHARVLRDIGVLSEIGRTGSSPLADPQVRRGVINLVMPPSPSAAALPPLASRGTVGSSRINLGGVAVRFLVR